MSSLVLAADASLSAERRAGDYLLERRLGRGAMGEVWLGRHVRTGGLGAVKMIRGGPRARERMARFFARERRAIARLAHPHIVALFDVGPDFIVTAYIDGSDLSRRLETPIDPARAVEITLEIASALAHAHASRVVHRDVKPSNILLDSQGNAFLADFGLASLLDDGEGATEGERAGTPQYMAPEQERGETAGPASDQYALARTLTEMLAGGSVARDAHAAIGDLPSSLPAALGVVVRRATAPRPADRWPSVEEFAAALGAIELGAHPAPRRLLPEVRVRTPYAWAAAPDAVRQVGHDTTRAEYRLSALASAGLLPAGACARFREKTAYEDFGWSVLGRTHRVGPITEPSAFARATELVVLLHGTFCTREAWMGIAPPLTRDNAHALILVPDLNGFGVSRKQDPSVEQLSPRGLLEAVLSWLDLLGVRELPTVIVGHSFAATALLTTTDVELGPRTSRVALTPVFPFFDRALYWQLRLLAPVLRWVGAIPGVRRLLGQLLFVWSKQTRIYTAAERAVMLRHFMSVPLDILAKLSRGLAETRSPPGDPLNLCTVVACEKDPVAPIGKTLDALARLGLPERSLYRLACDGHQPHALIDEHPEWTQRNVHEIVAIIDHLMVSSREGTVLPTEVASTIASTDERQTVRL